jgi:hypothetical protein
MTSVFELFADKALYPFESKTYPKYVENIYKAYEYPPPAPYICNVNDSIKFIKASFSNLYLNEFSAVIAGGFLSAQVMNKTSDYDIFIIASDKEDFNKKLINFMNHIRTMPCPGIYVTKNCFTFKLHYQTFQIIHYKFYNNIASIFEEFDNSACMVAYNGIDVLFNAASIYTFNTFTMILNSKVNNVMVPYRTQKYIKRGFSIQLAELPKDAKITIYDKLELCIDNNYITYMQILGRIISMAYDGGINYNNLQSIANHNLKLLSRPYIVMSGLCGYKNIDDFCEELASGVIKYKPHIQFKISYGGDGVIVKSDLFTADDIKALNINRCINYILEKNEKLYKKTEKEILDLVLKRVPIISQTLTLTR